MMSYIELQITSNFSFLRGASHPDELMQQAALIGYKTIAINDRNTFAGIVRAHVAAKKSGIRLIPSCRLDLLDGPSLLAYPTDKQAYGRLSTLLTVGNMRAEKGQCHLYKADVYQHQRGMKFILIPPDQLDNSFNLSKDFIEHTQEYQKNFGDDLYLGAQHLYRGNDGKVLFRLHQLSHELNIKMVAIGDVHYHIPERRELQDILTCIREKCTIHTAGFKLHANAERYLKPPQEMQRLFRKYPEAILHSQEIANACHFSLDSLEYVYPAELSPNGRTPQEELVHLTWEGAKRQFGEEIPTSIRDTINMELEFIERKNYAAYFLTVHDYVCFARDRGILCQGRGSAANSVICFCLGITSVNPSKIKLLFARFMSDARNEPPDIDVDFEHERREEVIQYIYEKYGRNRAAIVATVTQVRSKGALRDVAKAMGLSLDMVSKLSATISNYWQNHIDNTQLIEHGFNPKNTTLKKVIELASQYLGFPRQLGQHTGGFVITQGNLHELCPLINARMDARTNLEWNKDDLEALGFLKVDVLALGMLTCIRKAFDLAQKHYNKDYNLANIKQDDPDVYKMICKADTIGVFQIESRAQMSMLPRLRPKTFYDLVIEVAIVRPGPIQGDMVHPYLRRRNGEEAEEYPSEELRAVLQRTMGVPLFQEQAMEIAIVAAGFSAAEADELRRSMATFKFKGQVSSFYQKMIDGMKNNGYTEEFAIRVFKQLEGFGSYGFPESHAASFALLVYVSAWIKCHFPEVFAASLLNCQPMGFYQPAQIIIDAQKHNVKILPIDVNHSDWDNILESINGESMLALRLGFRQIKGIGQNDVKAISNIQNKRYTSITQLMDAGISPKVLEKLADADAFGSLGLNRRQALWEISALSDIPIALFQGQPSESELEGQLQLPLMTKSENVVHDYASTGLSIKAHPVSFLRHKLDLLHVVKANKFDQITNNAPIKTCGLVTVRQRPATAKGVLFITIEDETGFVNLVIWKNIFEKYRKEILRSKLLMVAGKIQKEGQVVHVIAERCFDMTELLKDLTQSEEDKNIFHKGRNFH